MFQLGALWSFVTDVFFQSCKSIIVLNIIQKHENLLKVTTPGLIVFEVINH